MGGTSRNVSRADMFLIFTARFVGDCPNQLFGFEQRIQICACNEVEISHP